MNPRLTPEPIAHGIAVIMNAYIDWMHAWEPDPQWHIHPHHFLDDRWAFVELDTDPYETCDYEMWSLTVDYGDDGGPQGLTAWFGYDYNRTDDEECILMSVLEHLTQTFDTRLALVMQGGKLTFNGKDSP